MKDNISNVFLKCSKIDELRIFSRLTWVIELIFDYIPTYLPTYTPLNYEHLPNFLQKPIAT